MDAELKSALTDARAQTMWGTPDSEIRASLQQHGLTDEQIDTVMEVCLRERAGEVRRLGIRDTLIGVGLLVLAVVIFVGGLLVGRVIGYAVLPAAIGLWSLQKGVWHLIRGAKATGSVTDM